MKTLSDGKKVTSRTYYYLLDWRDRHYDKFPLTKLFNKEKLSELTLEEYIQLFELATNGDILEMKYKK